MLQTQKKHSDTRMETTPPNTEESDEQSGERPHSPPKDPTRYGDWEVAGRCIDF